MNDKVTVPIVEGEKGVLKYTDEKGKTHEYRREAIRSFSVKVSSLVVCGGFTTWSHEENPQQPTLKRHLRGSAALEDRSISVIGDPHNIAKVLPISITVRSAEEHAEAVAWRTERREASNAEKKADERPELFGEDDFKYFDASLGFIEGDWEIGNDDEWYLQLYVSEAIANDLADSILKGQLRALSVGLKLWGAYTDDYHAPPSASIEWFLRPDSDGNPNRPETAHGTIGSWYVEYGKVEATSSAKVTAESESADEPVTMQPASSTSLTAHTQPSAWLEVASRFIKALQIAGGLLIWILYFVGAYSVYMLWNVDRQSRYPSDVLNALLFGWVVIAAIAAFRAVSMFIGWAVLIPIEARIRGLNLRDPEVASKTREEIKTALVLEGAVLAIFVAVPLLIAQYRFRFFW